MTARAAKGRATSRERGSQRVIRCLVVTMLVCSSLACLDTDSVGIEGPRSAAPSFTLPTLAGSEIALDSLLGKIVIVDFWATWCAPCEVQMPVLDTLRKEQGEAGLEVIGISVDTLAPPKIEAWVRDRGFEYPIALGDQELAMRYGAIGFPTLVVIDPQGGIHTRHTGVLSRPELDEIIESIRLESRSEP